MTRNFKGIWIDKDIWMNPDLSITEKCLLAEISSLDNDKGCYASNKYFAEFFCISIKTISRSIAKLVEMELLSAEYEKKQANTKRVLKCLFHTGQIVQNDQSTLDKLSISHGTKSPTSNTVLNNTNKKEEYLMKLWTIDQIKSHKYDEIDFHTRCIGVFNTFTFYQPNNKTLDELKMSEWFLPLRRLTKKYDWNIIGTILNWTLEHKFWGTCIVDTQSFEKSFEKISLQYQAYEKSEASN